MTIAYTFRPLGLWTEPETKPRRSASVFRATWADTLELLSIELGRLDARNAHPDTGGTAATFTRLQEAMRLLDNLTEPS
jgi:hypothetical protein